MPELPWYLWLLAGAGIAGLLAYLFIVRPLLTLIEGALRAFWRGFY